jgi:hypothetical protein
VRQPPTGGEAEALAELHRQVDAIEDAAGESRSVKA